MSGSQTPTPRNSGFLDKEVVEGLEVNGVVNGEAGDIKHKVNGNTSSSSSPLKSKHEADGSNNNDLDSIPCV